MFEVEPEVGPLPNIRCVTIIMLLPRKLPSHLTIFSFFRACISIGVVLSHNLERIVAVGTEYLSSQNSNILKTSNFKIFCPTTF